MWNLNKISNFKLWLVIIEEYIFKRFRQVLLINFIIFRLETTIGKHFYDAIQMY